MIFVDHIENAYHSLRRNRARSVLTTLGIAIGIASITCILALSSGVSRMINQQIEAYSGNLVVVRRDYKPATPMPSLTRGPAIV